MSNPASPEIPKPGTKWASKIAGTIRRPFSPSGLGHLSTPPSEVDNDTKSRHRSTLRNSKAPQNPPPPLVQSPLSRPILTEKGVGGEEAIVKADTVVPSPFTGTIRESAVGIPQPPTVVNPYVEPSTPALPPSSGTPKPTAKWASKMGAAMRRSPSLLSLGRSSEADADTKSVRRSASRSLKMPHTLSPPPVQSSPLMSTSTLEGSVREESITNDDFVVVDSYAETNTPLPLPPTETPKSATKWPSKMVATISRSSSRLSLRRAPTPLYEADTDAKSLWRSTSRSLEMPQAPPPPVESPPLMPTSILESPTRDEAIIKDDIGVTPQPTPPSMPTSILEALATEEAMMESDAVGSSPLARTDIESAVKAPQPTKVIDPYADTNTTSSEADADTKSLQRSMSRNSNVPQTSTLPVQPPVAYGVIPLPTPPSIPTSVLEISASEEATMRADIADTSPLAGTVKEPEVETEAAESVESPVLAAASAAEMKAAAPADEATSPVGYVLPPAIDVSIDHPGAFTDLPEELLQPEKVVDPYTKTDTPAPPTPAEDPAVAAAPKPMVAPAIKQSNFYLEVAVGLLTVVLFSVSVLRWSWRHFE
ncbi:hypothetical protein D9619_009081 [Psilocybe cf. subviscida]|uniref:Uncharacterized protein n=1 Tax=Psilocybe cf. subviscida TaxID=2480587 RepID=A0A8H5BUJ6_9AGAR|nr:hypothetical protein D9619_009081 [Psilocybe cf. subviscida]